MGYRYSFQARQYLRNEYCWEKIHIGCKYAGWLSSSVNN